MAQSDQDWVNDYAKGESTPKDTCKSCGQPMPQDKKKKEPSTLPEARRALPSGNYSRPRFGGLTVAPQ